MKVYEFSLFGNPTSWNRPARGRHGKRYDSQKSLKEQIQLYIQANCITPIVPPKNTPVQAEITFCFLPPASMSKKKRDSLIGTLKFTKPDLDNLEKFLYDTIEKTYFYNDSQVAEHTTRKVYSNTVRTDVKIIIGGKTTWHE